jgi:DNA-binding CsgD family transcriptional regulator
MTAWDDGWPPNEIPRRPDPWTGGPPISDSALDATLALMAVVYGVDGTELAPIVIRRGTRTPLVPDETAIEHLAHAAEDAAAAAFATLVDHLPFALVVTDHAAQVMLANSVAARALDARDPIAICDGRLDAPDGRAGVCLRNAIAQACSWHGPRSATLVPLTADALRACVIVGIQHTSDRRSAAVLFPDRDRVLCAVRTLGSMFSLTPAEARLVVMMMQGRTLVETARALNIRTHTAGDVWKTVCLKMSCETGSECLRILRAALLVADRR